jgi:replicative DNA helicase
MSNIKQMRKSCWYKGEKKTGTYFRVYISGDIDKIPCKIERKKARKNLSDHDRTLSPFKLEPLGEGDYYGFEIDGNRRFLLQDYTVTHNTALALKMLKNTSDAGVISVFASLDMRRNRLFEKLLYRVSGLPRNELYAKIKNREAGHIFQQVKDEYKNVYFYDRSAPTVDDIRRYILNIEEKTGQKVKLVMIDYFERVNADKSDETAASKEVAGKLQDLLNDLNVCLVTLVQPNKFSLSGGPDTPILNYTAIKGSSYLYQAFRSIISIWRPFFTPQTKDYDKFLQMGILKNDLGELGMFDFGWDGKRGEIWSLTEEEQEELKEALKKKNEAKAAVEGNWE